VELRVVSVSAVAGLVLQALSLWAYLELRLGAAEREPVYLSIVDFATFAYSEITQDLFWVAYSAVYAVE
jgi:hypothetical protein